VHRVARHVVWTSGLMSSGHIATAVPGG
jgi:hypothetical protein